MRISRAAAAVAAALSASACVQRSPLDASSQALVVHAVLNAANDEQIIDVQRMTPGYQSGNEVDSAIATITGPDGVVMTAVEDVVANKRVQPVYRVRLSTYSEQLVPGGTYRLHVHLPSGEDVTGMTTIPDAQTTAPPRDVFVFNKSRDTLRLAWPRVAGAMSYELRVQSDSGIFAMFADTSVTMAGNRTSLEGGSVFTNGQNTQVSVSAVDANYYQYYRSNSDEFTGTAVQGNLTGALGVFGSLVVIVVRFLHVTTN